MKSHFRRIPRYMLVAIGCAFLHNAILIGADALGANYFWCQVASAAVLLPVGFLLQSRVTFQCARNWSGFFRYSGALITNFPVALLILWVARDLAALPMWAAAPLSSLVLFCWNYVSSCWALSRKPAYKEMPAHG